MLSNTLFAFEHSHVLTAQNVELPKDCQEVKDRGNVASGQYMISPQDDEPPFRVYCDLDTDGGGWTVCKLFVLNNGTTYT